jgi:hypothetical protein
MKASFDFISPCKIIFLDLIAIKRLVLYQPSSTFFFIPKIEKMDKISFGEP